MMKRNFKATVERLAALEQAWRGRQFLAPVLAPGRARLRLEGLLFEVGVQPRDFNGFGVFTMAGPGHAELLRLANPRERDRYFELWPRLQVRLLLKAAEQAWLACPSGADQGTRPLLVGAVPEGVTPFELVHVGYDGVRAWFREPILNTNLRLAEQLAEALERGVRPADLRLRGLTPADRAAYAMVHAWRFGPELAAASTPCGTRQANSGPAGQGRAMGTDAALVRGALQKAGGEQVNSGPAGEDRAMGTDAALVRGALRKAGGDLRSFSETHGQWNVHWLDTTGQAHFSLVRPSDLTVVSSGICLSGRDSDFDLTSLVGVVEGQ